MDTNFIIYGLNKFLPYYIYQSAIKYYQKIIMINFFKNNNRAQKKSELDSNRTRVETLKGSGFLKIKVIHLSQGSYT